MDLLQDSLGFLSLLIRLSSLILEQLDEKEGGA